MNGEKSINETFVAMSVDWIMNCREHDARIGDIDGSGPCVCNIKDWSRCLGDFGYIPDDIISMINKKLNGAETDPKTDVKE